MQVTLQKSLAPLRRNGGKKGCSWGWGRVGLDLKRSLPSSEILWRLGWSRVG